MGPEQNLGHYEWVLGPQTLGPDPLQCAAIIAPEAGGHIGRGLAEKGLQVGVGQLRDDSSCRPPVRSGSARNEAGPYDDVALWEIDRKSVVSNKSE